MTDAQQIIEEAERELRNEQRRKAIDEAKEQIRAKDALPFWVKLFPWRIKIERRF